MKASKCYNMKFSPKKIKYKTIVACGCVLKVSEAMAKELLRADKKAIRKMWDINQLD